MDWEQPIHLIPFEMESYIYRFRSMVMNRIFFIKAMALWLSLYSVNLFILLFSLYFQRAFRYFLSCESSLRDIHLASYGNRATVDCFMFSTNLKGLVVVIAVGFQNRNFPALGYTGSQELPPLGETKQSTFSVSPNTGEFLFRDPTLHILSFQQVPYTIFRQLIHLVRNISRLYCYHFGYI